MKYEDFEDTELHCVKRWVLVYRGVLYSLFFKYTEGKRELVLMVDIDKQDTSMYVATQEHINALLVDGYEV